MAIFTTEFTVLNRSYCIGNTGFTVDFSGGTSGGIPGVLFASTLPFFELTAKIHRNMNIKNEQKELSYYGLYLLSYLKENHPDIATDKTFIESRSALAADTYEQARKEEYTPEGAQELAMAALLQGLHFSRYNILIEVLWNEFTEEVPQGDAANLAIKLQPSLEEIFAKYPLSDDFAYTPEYDALYTELTGAIMIHIEAHGI